MATSTPQGPSRWPGSRTPPAISSRSTAATSKHFRQLRTRCGSCQSDVLSGETEPGCPPHSYSPLSRKFVWISMTWSGASSGLKWPPGTRCAEVIRPPCPHVGGVGQLILVLSRHDKHGAGDAPVRCAIVALVLAVEMEAGAAVRAHGSGRRGGERTQIRVPLFRADRPWVARPGSENVVELGIGIG